MDSTNCRSRDLVATPQQNRPHSMSATSPSQLEQAWIETFISGCTMQMEMGFSGRRCGMSDAKRRLISRGAYDPQAKQTLFGR
jgi:hypothetical protein